MGMNPLTENPFKDLSRKQAIAVGAGSLIVIAALEYRHHKTTGSWNPFAKTAATGDASGTIDSLTGLPVSQDNVTDPLTGEAYLAEAQQYGSVAAAEAAVSAYGQTTGTGSGIGVQPVTGGLDGSTNPQPGSQGSTTYTDNAAWAQAATAGLSQIGYPETDVATALGLYIESQPVTTAQAQIIGAARAEYGPPPIPGPTLVLQPPATPRTVTSTAPAVSGGHVITATRDTAVVGWTGQNAAHYQVKITGPGKINGQVNTVTGTQASYTDLESGHDYEVTVTPYGANGAAGTPGTIDFTTTSTPPNKK